MTAEELVERHQEIDHSDRGDQPCAHTFTIGRVMPCQTDYLEPDYREAESVRVLEFMLEINGEPFDHNKPGSGPYGNPNALDIDTATVCAWCETHDVSKMSLELQLWWKQHQKADAQRKAREQDVIDRKEASEREMLALLRKKYG